MKLSSMNWQRGVGVGVAIGAIAVMGMATAASAQPPYEEHSWHVSEQPSDTDMPDTPTMDYSGFDMTQTPFEGHVSTDIVKLTAQYIDFGDSTRLAGAPVGPGSVDWDVVDGFYTPQLIGTLHMNNADGKFGRMHVSYWSGGQNLETRHAVTHHAIGDQHQEWPVNISPLTNYQFTEVHVCTEISDDGITFDTVNCKTRYL
jgi:hypothetical protein